MLLHDKNKTNKQTTGFGTSSRLCCMVSDNVKHSDSGLIQCHSANAGAVYRVTSSFSVWTGILPFYAINKYEKLAHNKTFASLNSTALLTQLTFITPTCRHIPL